MATPSDELLLRTERNALLALSVEAPRPRPEVQRRLRVVTAQLLSLELTRRPAGIPEAPESDGHRLAWWQK